MNVRKHDNGQTRRTSRKGHGRSGVNKVNKDVLTTGEVAKICNVAPRTVSKWFDSGQLRGYRIPGSKDRRIPRQQLIRFMKAHGMPLDGIETGQTRVLVVDNEPDMLALLDRALQEADYAVRTASGAFEAGAAAESFRPHVIIVDVSLPDLDSKQLCRHIRSDPDLRETRLVAMSGGLTEGEGQALLQEGFDAYLCKPFEIRQLIAAIEGAPSPV